jgi:hypothetical protein
MPGPEEKFTPITLNCVVRERKIKVVCGSALQNVKWLGGVVANRYASYHPEFHPCSFVCINVQTADGTVCFPSEEIVRIVKNNDTLHFDILGPRIGLNDPAYTREKTLWELFAYTAPYDFSRVEVRYYASSKLDSVGLIGNFNKWDSPYEMKKSQVDNLVWKFILPLPAFAQICFRFIVGGKSVVSDYYQIVSGENSSNQFNYFVVKPQKTEYLQNEVPSISQIPIPEQTEVKRLPENITGKFIGVPVMSTAKRLEQLRNDWQVQLILMFIIFI